MKYTLKSLFFICGAMVASLLSAQTDTVANFECDFENTIQNAQWHFPTTDATPHQWTIGQAVNNGGLQSMYVTTKGHDTACYVNKDAIVYAYIDITLEKSSEKFILSFDWMGVGYAPNKTDGIYVFWVPDNDDLGRPITFADQNNSSIPDILAPYALELNPALGDNALRGKASWQAWISNNSSQSDSRLRGGQHRRLVFAWRSTTDGPVNPGACIDNINIVDGRACAAPSKLVVTTAGEDSLILNWKGEGSALYEVGCYSYEKKEWKTLRVDTNYYVFQNIPEGFTDFYVRSVCYDENVQREYYSAKSQDSRFIYYPGNHCIDYITMTDDNCFTNTEDTKVSAVHDIDKVKWQQGMVTTDDPKTSRHTLCTSKVEIDPNTTNTTDGAMLKMVPDGELASVRLGNWNTGGEAERVEFDFHVDVNVNPILVMKYAVVLQHPGESCIPNPGFRLRVLKKAGKKAIGNRCAMADFDYKAAADKDWHMSYPGGSSTDVRWKDWTTVGINLSEYDGEDLIIQLTTYDCGGGGHYGYAYFTLGCAKDNLDGQNCDGKPSTEFSAPAGFNYRWYRKNDPTHTMATSWDGTPGNQQKFKIDSLDQNIYCVDVIFPEDSTCYFTLEACSQPHYPVADFNVKYTPHDCKNHITITNNAHVEDKNLKTQQIVTSPVDSYKWDFGSIMGISDIAVGKSVEVLLPDSGGQFPITLSAVTGNCEDVRTITVDIPAVAPQLTVEDVIILKGESYMFNDTLRSTDGVYVNSKLNYQGCDSVSQLILTVHENLSAKFDEYLTLCADAPYWELPYQLSGMRKGATYSLSWPFNTEMPTIVREPIPANDVMVLPMPKQMYPDVYKALITFHDSLTGTDPKIQDFVDTLTLHILYPDSVMTIRWNEVLAVRNASYNGGFEFTGYQWYKNGQPITGANESYYIEESGLDRTATYCVLLTRADSMSIFTCPFDFNPSTGIDDVYGSAFIPSFVSRNSTFSVAGCGMATWVDMLGTVVRKQSFIESIQTPAIAGMYILYLQDERGNTQVARIIVH
ncbi:MAG: hypothetical protein MJZ88_00005 [Paludibacteraceae bacterium]|nr:hypothetical protein [Paludibacteraceae bacterium]